MHGLTLDAIDRKLLKLLQKDNRQPLRDLGEQLGVSAPTCMRRLRRLEVAGVIRGHTALLDPARLGYGVSAFVEVMLVNPSGAEMAAFERRMSRRAEVIQCSELAGDVDYLLTVMVKHLQEFADFTRSHLGDDRSVRSYRSHLVLRQLKNEHVLAL